MSLVPQGLRGKGEEESGMFWLYSPRNFVFISKTHHNINEISTENLQQFTQKSEKLNLMLVS